MRRFCILIILGVGIGVFFLNIAAIAQNKGSFSTDPTKNSGEKWRMGFYQGGDYTDYPKVFTATVLGLMDLGWIESTEIPSFEGKPTEEFWNWLIANTNSEYIEFVKDAFYSADWNTELREKIPGEIIARLTQKQDIDLMIAMGTWAGQDLANDNHGTSTVVLSSTDPLGSGIIKSVEDSGYDHVHARIDPLRQERQVLIFHDILGFQRMGIYYTDTTDGRSYAAINKVESVAEEMGFELVRCFTKGAEVEIQAAVESVEACVHELGEQADALFIAIHPAVKVKNISALVEIANSYQIPTFSQSGSEEVKFGILMSISQAGFKYLGQFEAETIAKILNGAQARQIDQLFEDPPKIAINLKTAEIIGYDPPVDVLGAADEIYQEIEKPE